VSHAAPSATTRRAATVTARSIPSGWLRGWIVNLLTFPRPEYSLPSSLLPRKAQRRRTTLRPRNERHAPPEEKRDWGYVDGQELFHLRLFDRRRVAGGLGFAVGVDMDAYRDVSELYALKETHGAPYALSAS
jgi:hypothetical protein